MLCCVEHASSYLMSVWIELSDLTIHGVIYLNSFVTFLSDMIGFVDTDTCLVAVTLWGSP